MAKSSVSKARRSVAFMPESQNHVERIVEARGVSANRAIEDAVAFYSKCLSVISKKGSLVGFIIEDNSGNKSEIPVLF